MHPIEIDGALKPAKNHLRSGKVAEADAMYQQALRIQRRCAEAKLGQWTDVIERLATALRERVADVANSLAAA